jgi:chromosome segregation ATPase
MVGMEALEETVLAGEQQVRQLRRKYPKNSAGVEAELIETYYDIYSSIKQDGSEAKQLDKAIFLNRLLVRACSLKDYGEAESGEVQQLRDQLKECHEKQALHNKELVEFNTKNEKRYRELESELAKLENEKLAMREQYNQERSVDVLYVQGLVDRIRELEKEKPAGENLEAELEEERKKTHLLRMEVKKLKEAKPDDELLNKYNKQLKQNEDSNAMLDSLEKQLKTARDIEKKQHERIKGLEKELKDKKEKKSSLFDKSLAEKSKKVVEPSKKIKVPKEKEKAKATDDDLEKMREKLAKQLKEKEMEEEEEVIILDPGRGAENPNDGPYVRDLDFDG